MCCGTPLSEALKDSDINVRRSVAWALRSSGDGRAVVSLIETLKDQDLLVRRYAAQALGQIGDPRAIEPLIKAGATEALLKFDQNEVEHARKSILMPQMKVGNLHISLITNSLLQPHGSLNKKISDRLTSKGMAISDRNLVYELGIEDVLELVSVSGDVAKQYIDALKMMV
jgi:hypothetical protein